MNYFGKFWQGDVILQVFAIEFVAFAIEFVPFAIEFVGIAIEFVPFAIEFVGFAIEFVGFAVELVGFAIEFVASVCITIRHKQNGSKKPTRSLRDELFMPWRVTLETLESN